MKELKRLVPFLAILLCVSLSCTSLRDKFSGLASSDSAKAPNLRPFDPDGEMASPGAYVLRILAADEPALSAMADQVEAAERKMMKQIIDENRPGSHTDDTKKAFSGRSSNGANAIGGQRPQALSSHLMFQSDGLTLPTGGDGAVFGGFTGYLKGMLAEALTNEKFNKKDTKTEPVDGGTTSMNSEIGVNPDGSSVFEIGIVTETEKNGVKARTESRSRIEGQDCPNAEGQLPFTIKLRLSGQSGNSKYEQDVTVFVRVVVDDNAEMASKTLDITHGTSRTRNGKTTYFERGLTYRRNAGDEEGTLTNQRVAQKTDNVSLDDVTEATMSGDSVAYGVANAAISAAESAWKGGACIKIDASSPGAVEVNSSTAIPVKVLHRKEGIEVPAKLEASLTGGVSVEPAVIPKTAGTLTYIAPGETGKSAEIKLKATSRRGIAILDLNANTGSNAFRIEGGLDDWQTNTVVCDIMKPFTLTGGGFTMNFSGGLSGTYSYTGPFNAKGTGTYQMKFPHGQKLNGEMVGQGDGTVTGAGKVYGASGTENYSLMIVDGPCVDGPVKE